MNDPHKFETNKSFFLRDANVFVSQMIKQMKWIKYNEKVLDYGSGCGSTGFNHILPQVYLHDSHLYSVDISEEMVTYASRNYPHPLCTYAIGDIMSGNYPFKYIKFDKIFSTYVLQFIKDYKGALTRFYEELNPGGQFGFTMITNYFCFTLHQKLGKSERWGKFMEDYEEYIPEVFEQKQNSTEVFRACLEKIGFEIVVLQAHELEWEFDTEEAIEFYLATSPFTMKIPLILQEEFKKDVHQVMVNSCNLNQDSKVYEMKYEMLYGFVKKSGAQQQKERKNRYRFSLP